MYARVVVVPIEHGTADETARIYQEHILPVMKKQRGFRGQLFLTQRYTEKALSINLWETEEDLREFESSQTFRQILNELAGVLVGRPISEIYEVALQTQIAEESTPSPDSDH